MSIETIKPRLEAYLQFYCSLADGPDERNKVFRYAPFELACSRLLLVDQVTAPSSIGSGFYNTHRRLVVFLHETNAEEASPILELTTVCSLL